MSKKQEGENTDVIIIQIENSTNQRHSDKIITPDIPGSNVKVRICVNAGDVNFGKPCLDQENGCTRYCQRSLTGNQTT